VVRLPPAVTDFPTVRGVQTGRAAQWAPHALFTGRKRSGREAYQPPPSSVEVKNEGCHASMSSWCQQEQLYIHSSSFSVFEEDVIC